MSIRNVADDRVIAVARLSGRRGRQGATIVDRPLRIVLWSVWGFAALLPLTALAQASASQPPQSDSASVAPPSPKPAQTDTTQSLDEAFSLQLDESLDVGVPWPDLNAVTPDLALPDASPDTAEGDGGLAAGPDTTPEIWGEPPEVTQPDAPVLADDGSERRYVVEVSGLDELESADQLRERFNALSLLKERDGKPANIAQINRRMKEDELLLERILDAKGYYDAVIRSSIQPPEKEGDRLRAVLRVQPGSRYALSRVSLPGLAIAEAKVPSLRAAFPVAVGDPIDADKIEAAQAELAIALGDHGFPFATVEEPVVTIDHETIKGDLEVVVRSGGYRLFGDIVMQGTSGRVFSARHLSRIARFDRGDVYQASDVEDLRRAIIATGLASSVSLEPSDAGDAEHVNIAVDLSRAPPRTIAGALGYGTGEGFRAEVSWQHRNLFPPEGAITVRGLVGTREQAAGVLFRRNNFLRRDNILSASLSARHQNLDAFEAKTITLSAGLERQTNVLYQKKWTWSIGGELTASRETDFSEATGTETQRDYLIVAVPGAVTRDATDDLLNPTDGFRLGVRLSPEVARQNGVFAYVRAQVDGSIYYSVSDSVVLASRVRLGSILGGVSSDRIAPSRRFYAGGGASVRGYAYQAIGPRDPDNDPLGGKSLTEFSLEARIRFGSFGVVPFLDAGNISRGFLPNLGGLRYGAGIGVRYYTSFGPIRVDVGTPLNRQAGDSRIGVYVSLGQAF